MYRVSYLSFSSIKTQEEVLKEQGNSEEELNYIEDACVKDVVEIHNQLFGTSDLVKAVRFLRKSMDFFFFYC